jgi:uncharacterized protein YbjQ (UPF0145 family)
MKYRTEIDLSKMNSLGRIIYLQALLRDCAETIRDLAGDHSSYDYIEHTIEHAEQAVSDLRKIKSI